VSQIQISSYSAVSISTFHSNHRAHIFDSTLTAILAISTVARVGAIKVQLRVGAATTKRRDRRLIPSFKAHIFDSLGFTRYHLLTFNLSSKTHISNSFLLLRPLSQFEPFRHGPAAHIFNSFLLLHPLSPSNPSTSVPRLIFPIHSSSYAHYHLSTFNLSSKTHCPIHSSSSPIITIRTIPSQS
jgi:hypothetical protein